MRALLFAATLLVSAPALADFAPTLTCAPAEATHTYVASPLPEVDMSHTGFGVYADPNLEDCDGDGEALDFDGENNLGLGGAFFPADHHGQRFVVEDAGGEIVRFVVGADLAGSPAISRNEGDCVQGFWGAGTTTCPAGRAGGWTVFVGCWVDPATSSARCATAGSITST